MISGRYQGQIVRITNISTNDSGKKNAACFLSDGSRANIPLSELSIIEEKPEPQEEKRFAKTASMPFVSGSSSSRTLTHTKNMAKGKMVQSRCPKCGKEMGANKICDDCEES